MKAFFCLAFFALAVSAIEEYRGDQVLRINPKSQSDVELLKKYILANQDLDTWAEPSAPGHNADIRVPHYKLDECKKMLERNEIEYSIMVPDVEDLLNEERVSNQKNAFSSYFDYEKYNQWSEIKMELHNLARQYSSRVTLIKDIGRTFEGEPMLALKVTNGDGVDKPVIWIDGGIHAREWISPATVLYFMKKVIDGQDGRVQRVLSKYDFYFLPVFNIDGYKFTHIRNYRDSRFWRKTRSYGRAWCIGADPNRNWDSHWDIGVGTSDDPCSDTYRGPRAESEIEVKNVAKYLRGLNLKSYWNVHAYSQLVLTPWSYKKELPDDYKEIERVGKVFSDALYSRFNTVYEVGPPSRILYAVSGGSIDFAYESLGVKYSYALELRDKGRYGFVLPANQIKPSGEETSDGFLAAILAMK